MPAFKKTRERGARKGPGRDAFIDLARSMQMAERSVFSSAITQFITRVAARISPFLNGQHIPSVVEFINEIFPLHVSKHLADLRLKHLEEIEALQSGIRASKEAQNLKEAAAVGGEDVEDTVERGERGAIDVRRATAPAQIDFAGQPHVAETEQRQTVGRAEILSALGASNAAGRRAHSRAQPFKEANAKAASALYIPSTPTTKRCAFDGAWNKYRLRGARARVEELKAAMNAHL